MSELDFESRVSGPAVMSANTLGRCKALKTNIGSLWCLACFTPSRMLSPLGSLWRGGACDLATWDPYVATYMRDVELGWPDLVPPTKQLLLHWSLTTTFNFLLAF